MLVSTKKSLIGCSASLVSIQLFVLINSLSYWDKINHYLIKITPDLKISVCDSAMTYLVTGDWVRGQGFWFR